MNQNVYAVIFANEDPFNPGSRPTIMWYTSLDDAQSSYNDALTNVFNLTYVQILQVNATVIQATAGSPSGEVTP